MLDRIARAPAIKERPQIHLRVVGETLDGLRPTNQDTTAGVHPKDGDAGKAIFVPRDTTLVWRML